MTMIKFGQNRRVKTRNDRPDMCGMEVQPVRGTVSMAIIGFSEKAINKGADGFSKKNQCLEALN